MRLLLASVATLAAVALAAPAFAQETAPATATPTPIAKPKPGTAAYCNTLKSSTSKSTCLKRVHAQAATPKSPSGSTTHKKAKKLEAPKTDASAQMTPPAGAAPASGSTPSQTVNVPPLPQKTI